MQQFFPSYDAKDGFWSVHLDDASSHLTTFNTHKGRYRFLRMPFGLKMAQDVFQMRMDQITERLPGIIAIHDCNNILLLFIVDPGLGMIQL